MRLMTVSRTSLSRKSLNLNTVSDTSLKRVIIKSPVLLSSSPMTISAPWMLSLDAPACACCVRVARCREERVKRCAHLGQRLLCFVQDNVVQLASRVRATRRDKRQIRSQRRYG
jgi:hypothetical protein